MIAVAWLRIAMVAAVATMSLTNAWAQASPDHPAAVLVYPYVVVDTAKGTDTLIQLTNVSDEPVDVFCFYEDFTPQCTSGEPDAACLSDPVTCTGQCIARQSRIALRLRPTAGQPLSWQVSSGISEPPPGDRFGVTEVPGVGSGPFRGMLRCVAFPQQPARPADANILVGQATIQRSGGSPLPYVDAALYRAIGSRAIVNRTNRDDPLKLGGGNAEYEACPDHGILEHFADGAELRAGESTATIGTTLVMANCSRDLGAPFGDTVQFLIFNEFAQRFSTQRSIDGQLVTPLSQIDTRVPERSIFSSVVIGTIGARTLIRGVAGGLHMVAIESHSGAAGSGRTHSDALAVHGYGKRPTADYLAHRVPFCVGDCDVDGSVVIYEVVLGVNQAFGTQPIDACMPMDANLDSAVTVDEIVEAIDNALARCPESARPTPDADPQPTPAPTLGPVQSAGPQITHFGVATADDIPLQADGTDEMGRPVFVRPFGQGMTLIVEARRGQSGSPVTSASTYSAQGELPELQILASRPLGDGDPAVCENDGRRGGVPAVANLEFSTAASTIAAINDFGCRAYEWVAQPASGACTRRQATGIFAPNGPFGFVVGGSEAQFCIPIAKPWALPVGETTLAVRVRDNAGNVSAVKQIVVRVQEPTPSAPPTPTPTRFVPFPTPTESSIPLGSYEFAVSIDPPAIQVGDDVAISITATNVAGQIYVPAYTLNGTMAFLSGDTSTRHLSHLMGPGQSHTLVYMLHAEQAGTATAQLHVDYETCSPTCPPFFFIGANFAFEVPIRPASLAR